MMFLSYFIAFIDLLIFFIPKFIRVRFWSYLFFGSGASKVLSQFAFETGDFKSNLFLNYNNPSGMGLASKDTVRSGSVNFPEGSKSVYLSVGVGVYDFYLYCTKRFPSTIEFVRSGSVDDYLQKIKSNNYFTADVSTYFAGVKFYYDKYSKLNYYYYLALILIPFTEFYILYLIIKRLFYGKKR